MWLRILLVTILASATGCEAFQLRNRTVRQASTMTDLNYEQVLDNLAMFVSNPDSLPYFSLAPSGVTTIQQTYTPMGSLNWDYAFFGMVGAFKNHLDKKSLSLTANQQNIETWNTITSYYPESLKVMQCAYQKAVGREPCECEGYLTSFFFPPAPTTVPKGPKMTEPDSGAGSSGASGKNETGAENQGIDLRLSVIKSASAESIAVADTKPPAKKPDLIPPSERALKAEEYQSIHPGWFCAGKITDVPWKQARYVGHYGSTYVWVTDEGVANLSRFTLAILDIVTSEPQLKAVTPGVAKGSGVGGEEAATIQYAPVRRQFFPSWNQYIAPSPPSP